MELTPQTGYVKRFDEIYPDFDPSLNGIGGWLILLIIGRLFTIADVINIPKLISYYGVSASFDFYIVFTTCFAIIFEVALSIVILVFLFSRKIVFRTLFVIQCSIAIIFSLFTVCFFLGADTTWISLLRAIVGGAIWIYYVFVSKRVKNTYIYPKLYHEYEDMYGYANNNPAYQEYRAVQTMNVPRQEETIPKASATADVSYNISDIQIAGTDQVRCPSCNTLQRNDRECCYNCQAKFIH